MTFQPHNNPEVSFVMPLDAQLHTTLEDTRAALSLHSQADVIRLALQIVPSIVFENISAEALDQEVARLLEGTPPADTLPSSRTAGEQITKSNLLEGLAPSANARPSLVKARTNDLHRARTASEYCSLESVGDFAYRATRLIVNMEREFPDFGARVRATQAREDLIGRQALGTTDIQPWGEEDYWDYGLPDDPDYI